MSGQVGGPSPQTGAQAVVANAVANTADPSRRPDVLLRVRREGGYVYTESVVLRGASGTLRRITSEHLVSKWL